MCKLCLLVVASLAVVDVYLGTYVQYPFSATQNMSLEAYTPYGYRTPVIAAFSVNVYLVRGSVFHSEYTPYDTYRTPVIATFDIDVYLAKGSVFHLGPALFRTYRYGKYVNYSVS